jgi:DNA-binding GntR family transcriptional regulator
MFKTKAEYAYEILKKDIIDGRYPPDVRLTLTELSKAIDVSIVPVREALVQLEMESLVVQIPHQGYTVASMSVKEFEELLILRQVLEESAIPYVIRCIQEDELQVLYTLTDRMLTHMDSDYSQSDDIEKYRAFMTLNREFHYNVVKASRFTHLPPILNNVLDLSQRYINTIETLYGIRQVDIEEHVGMLDAIKAGDPVKLRTLYQKHYQRVLDEFRSYLAENETGMFGTK